MWLCFPLPCALQAGAFIAAMGQICAEAYKGTSSGVVSGHNLLCCCSPRNTNPASGGSYKARENMKICISAA